MKIIKQYWDFIDDFNGYFLLEKIELAGRTAYKSEDKITEGSAYGFCKKLIKKGHESVLEHVSISVRVITNRGVSHEIVRHRLMSITQESTRYVNYKEGITVILPVWFYDLNGCDLRKLQWETACRESEKHYLSLINNNMSPQQAREVLPNSLKTELILTANVREWRHFFKLRTAVNVHPQMRDLALSMLIGFREVIPVLFDDIDI